jgi:hypothetical protein
VYGGLPLAAWWWMLWTPGRETVPALQPLNASQLALERQLRRDVAFLARSIGERNPWKNAATGSTATFIDHSLQIAGYRTESQSYTVGGVACRNIEAAIRGLSRSLRFVAFANEEPPYFWTGDMGSLVYARKCKQAGDQIVAMLSIESVRFYSSQPMSQHYPAVLGVFFPATGDFVAFVGNTLSRPLLHTTLRSFRNTAALPSAGAAVPNIVPGAGWSDHWSFWQQGFPGIEITDTAPIPESALNVYESRTRASGLVPPKLMAHCIL